MKSPNVSAHWGNAHSGVGLHPISMVYWAIAGVLLGLLWASRTVDAFFGLRQIPDVSRGTPPHAPTASVSIIVPARNEESNVEAGLHSLLAQDYPHYEIVVVDDRSTDETGAILDRIASVDCGRLRVLHVCELPADWLGKTHAMWLAARNATSDWLLFTDADVVFRPGTLRRAVDYAEANGADHLVVAPQLQMHTAGERMMLAFFQILFIFGHRPWKVADPKARDHLGVGAFNMIRRNVYERIGGYRALRLAVLDDMKLGQAAKEGGFSQRYVFGGDLVSLRWAHGALGVVNNLTKNFFAIMEYRLCKALGFTLLLLLLNLGPFVGIACAPGWAKLGYLVALTMLLCLYIGMSWYSQVRPRYFVLHPVATLLFAYAMLRSTAVTLWRGAVVWRGTEYPLDDLRRDIL